MPGVNKLLGGSAPQTPGTNRPSGLPIDWAYVVVVGVTPNLHIDRAYAVVVGVTPNLYIDCCCRSNA